MAAAALAAMAAPLTSLADVQLIQRVAQQQQIAEQQQHKLHQIQMQQQHHQMLAQHQQQQQERQEHQQPRVAAHEQQNHQLRQHPPMPVLLVAPMPMPMPAGICPGEVCAPALVAAVRRHTEAAPVAVAASGAPGELQRRPQSSGVWPAAQPTDWDAPAQGKSAAAAARGSVDRCASDPSAKGRFQKVGRSEQHGDKVGAAAVRGLMGCGRSQAAAEGRSQKTQFTGMVVEVSRGGTTAERHFRDVPSAQNPDYRNREGVGALGVDDLADGLGTGRLATCSMQ